MSSIEPEVDPISRDFWSGVAVGEVRLVECCSCRRVSFPAIGACPFCGSEDVTSRRSSGNGSIYSWVTVHIALDPAFSEDTPYTVVAVDMEEGGRMLGRLLADEQEPKAGALVHFESIQRDGVALPGFRLSNDPEARDQEVL